MSQLHFQCLLHHVSGMSKTWQIAVELIGRIFMNAISQYVSHAHCNIVDTRTLTPLFDLADETGGPNRFDIRRVRRSFGSNRSPKKSPFCCFAFTMPAKLSINDVDVSGKRVFMRVDFNVPQDKADPTKSLGFQGFCHRGFLWFLVSDVKVCLFMFFIRLPINIATSTINLVTSSLSTTSILSCLVNGFEDHQHPAH